MACILFVWWLVLIATWYTWYNLESFGKTHSEKLYEHGWPMDMDIKKILMASTALKQSEASVGSATSLWAGAWTMENEEGPSTNINMHAHAHLSLCL